MSPGHRVQRGVAGLHRLTVHQDHAGAALFEPAAEPGPCQTERVAQDIEQRRIGGDIVRQRMVMAVY